MSTKRKVNGVIVGVIVGSLIFLGYQYFMVHENGEAIVEENGETAARVASDADNQEKLSSVDAFVDFVNDTDPDDNQNYTSQAFSYLTNALKDISGQSASVLDAAEVQALEEQVSAYEQNAGDVKELFAAATDAISHIRMNGEDDLQNKVSDLKEEVNEMNEADEKDELLDNEKEYFKKAADIMEEVEESM